VTLPLGERRLDAVLLDIEGTTTPMAFVHDVLFPFARTHLADWLDARSSSAEFNAVFEQLARENAADRSRGANATAWDTSTMTATQATMSRCTWPMSNPASTTSSHGTIAAKNSSIRG